MTAWLAALAFGVASALIPVANAEVYVGVAAAAESHLTLVGIVVALSVGQTLGKIAWYLVARRSMESHWIQKKLDKGTRRQSFEKWSDRLLSRPWVAALILLSSSLLGIPPLLVLAVVAGSVRVPLPIFVVTCLVGRLGRFALLAWGAGWALDLL